MKKELAAKLKAIEKTKCELAKLRDVLRGQVQELEEIVEDCDSAVDGISRGLRALGYAADDLSKYL